MWIVLILLITPLFAKSVNSELNFDMFTQEDGLPNNQIQCIFQDKKGWMWLGTSQGLSRFDGYRFVNFLSDPDDSTSLNGNLVRVIFEDSKGQLWIGTELGGLNLFNREKENFSHPFKNNSEFKFREVSINTIQEDMLGNLWLGTDNNILKIDTSGNLKALNLMIKGSQTSFSGNFVRNLKFDKNGLLWIGTNDGIFTYDHLSNEIEPFPIPFEENQNKEIWEIFLDDDGSIWIGTYSKGIFIINPDTKEIKNLALNPYIDRTETVRTISKGILGDYWIGTRGGLYKYSKKDGAEFYNHNELDLTSLSNNS
ncbi:MAG: hypothetical protein JXR31_05130, partial [Prolixibacteraceae bacterium]|nr:hypothetical protein [Prolixibacteraceae bacterium]